MCQQVLQEKETAATGRRNQHMSAHNLGCMQHASAKHMLGNTLLNCRNRVKCMLCRARLPMQAQAKKHMPRYPQALSSPG
jgi:hypothetical protein